MVGSSRLTSLVALPLSVACTSPPAGGDGSGGAVSSGGGSPSSGGSLGTGGSSAGGASTGGGTSSGSASGDGVVGGLGGEAASGGVENSGGTAGDGGTGGTPAAEPYGQCDEGLGEENNPGCAANEVCFGNTCMETCPTNLSDAAAYDCPELTSGTPPSRCAFVFGRCELVCEGQGSLPDYECPAGMDCVYARCVWP
jgi:hypothetical protein